MGMIPSQHESPDSKPGQAAETPNSLIESFDRLRMTVDVYAWQVLPFRSTTAPAKLNPTVWKTRGGGNEDGDLEGRRDCYNRNAQ